MWQRSIWTASRYTHEIKVNAWTQQNIGTMFGQKVAVTGTPTTAQSAKTGKLPTNGSNGTAGPSPNGYPSSQWWLKVSGNSIPAFTALGATHGPLIPRGSIRGGIRRAWKPNGGVRPKVKLGAPESQSNNNLAGLPAHHAVVGSQGQSRWPG